MKRFIIALLTLSFSLLSSNVKADEGMWLPMFIKRLNHVDMQKQGLQLTAEEIYSVNNSSLKDAIVHFDGGCTAELISSQGLLLTNHHCGYDAIANHSTPENDYLSNGFWAYNKKQELKNEGMTVSFLHRMDDVTDKVNSVLNSDMTAEERDNAVKTITNQIAKEASEDGKYRARVASFFKGNEFYLFVYKIYSDIRLVGAPPSSIGKFGGDTDNWMWPRHTGDFSIFRIYSDKNGEPATYSEENVPYTPKHYLPVSIKGVEQDDFAMILGYPGRTERYLTSWGINQKIGVEYPAFVDARDLKLKIMKKHMDKDAAVRIAYASNYASVANYWKNRIGMIKALTENKTALRKEKIESELSKWINENPERKKEYGKIFDTFKNYYSSTNGTIAGDQYLMEAGLQSSSFGMFNYGLSRQIPLLAQTEDSEEKEKIKAGIIKTVNNFFGEKSMALEEELTANMLELFYKKTPIEQQPAEFVEIVKEYNNDFTAMASDFFKNSIITDKERLLDLVNNIDTKADLYKNDKAAIVYSSFIQKYIDNIYMNADRKDLKNNLSEAERLFIKALRESNPDKAYYPDANSTMRLTYGKVMSYEPKDGIEYKYYTTLKGVIDKEDKNNPEFFVEEKLKDLYAKKDYGKYADKDGRMPVGFLTNNDITGGNSGSPVINGKGELIGCAFDGNWEAMSGDIEFEQDLQRTIVVDIRYVLFIIDKYAGATNLIEEMTIVE